MVTVKPWHEFDFVAFLLSKIENVAQIEAGIAAKKAILNDYT
jgi:hypothetical protein